MQEFVSQNGFGFYIWWSFGMTAALIIFEWLVTGVQRKSAIRKLKRIARMQETQDKVRS